MGPTQMPAAQFRIGHVNKWLSNHPFNESKVLDGRMMCQTVNYSVVPKTPVQASARPAVPVQAAVIGVADDQVELKKQPLKVSGLIQSADLASVGVEPRQLMADLVNCGWINDRGIVADSFFELTEPGKMNLPLSYDPVSRQVFDLLKATKGNYYLLSSNIAMNEHRADNPLTLFSAVDGVFSHPDHSAFVREAWTGRGGEMRHSLLLHILSVETPTIDPSAAVERMNAWFTDLNHCPAWAQPGQPNIFHSYDFKVSGDGKSGKDPHTDETIGNVLKRTHHFRLAASYFTQIVAGLENVGKYISKDVNVKPSEDSKVRPWNHSSQVAFMLDVLGHARFGTPKMSGDGA